MGLHKKQKLSSGLTVNYWSVQEVHINYSVREATFKLLGYKDEATFKAGGAHGDVRKVRMVNEEFDQYFPRNSANNNCTDAYAAAVAKEPIFADAEKV